MSNRFEIFPGGEILDRVADRLIAAGLFVGHLVTQRHVHNELSEHFHHDVHPPEPIHLNRWQDEEYDGDDGAA